jgi:2-hydroxy-3-oxopropionate reductase
MAPALERIGFIGLGIMGRPMARNLLKAGYPLVVSSRSPGPVAELVAAGAKAASSPREVAGGSDVIVTMLPGPAEVEAVIAGADGVLEGAANGALVIDMSSSSPALARRLAGAGRARGVGVLDAPVSGGDRGAIEATLSIMVGGEEADFERARPVFAAMGKTVVHCGPSGAGQTVKACNQVVVALAIEGLSEALVLGAKAGVRPELILQVLGGGLAQSRVMELRGPTMIRGSFEPGGKAHLHRKDLDVALQTARELGVALPVTALVSQMFTTLVEKGGGELDHSALLTVLEDLSNHRVAGPKS